MNKNDSIAPIAGVFPVLPTPFDEHGKPDVGSLRRLVRYLVDAGVDGMTYPGVASEFNQLTTEERLALTEIVLDEARWPSAAGCGCVEHRCREDGATCTSGRRARSERVDDCRAARSQDRCCTD